MKFIWLLFLFCLPLSLKSNNEAQSININTIHVIVALCDNASQAIAPVKPIIGNGDDPANNLYWGALYGVKTTFKRSADWRLVKTIPNPEDKILERCVFKHQQHNTYLIADAYRGLNIMDAVKDFLEVSSGNLTKSIQVGEEEVFFGGFSEVVTYIGHNALLEYDLETYPVCQDGMERQAIVLGCLSKDYFEPALRSAGAYPLLWTTSTMAPEGYILEGALKGWMNKESNDQIRNRAARAYSQYQKCSFAAAARILVTGW